MMRSLFLCVLCLGFTLIRPEPAGAAEPALFQKKAESLVKAAMSAEKRGDYKSALGRYGRAMMTLQTLRKTSPDYEPARIGKLIKFCEKKSDRLEEKLYPLPPGYVRLWPGMSRKRYTKGQALAGRVEDVGENVYEVDGSTVKIHRAGRKIGATCSCKDFLYRGLDGNFPCKHIWGVTISEKLLGGGSKK